MPPTKRDVGVSVLSGRASLKDGAVQTEQWIKNVSSKLIQTLMRPLTDSGTQTPPPPPARPAKPSQVSHQTVQVDLMPKVLEMVIPKAHSGTQTLPAEEVIPPPMSYKPIVFHRQSQTDTIQVEEVAVKPEKEQLQQRRKSIGVGDGAVSDVLCERCTSKRTRHAAVGTDPIRPLSGVNVATQSYETTCQVIQGDIHLRV